VISSSLDTPLRMWAKGGEMIFYEDSELAGGIKKKKG
jgi:hypothetical protein